MRSIRNHLVHVTDLQDSMAEANMSVDKSTESKTEVQFI